MDWLITLGIVVVAAGAIFVLVMGIAVHDLRGHLRRGISDASSRQAQSLRTLTEGMAALQREQRDSQAQIQALIRANRKLAEELARLSAQVDDDRTGMRVEDDRVLH
jgi:hypothetical protein